MHKGRILGILAMLTVGVLGTMGVFFVLRNGRAVTDAFALMGLTASTSTLNLEIEVEKSNDISLTNPFYMVNTGKQTGTFVVSVSGLPKSASTRIFANSLAPEIASATAGFPDEKGNSVVYVTAYNGGRADIKITTASGGRVMYVTVNVKMEAKAVILNPGEHNGIVQSNDKTTVLTFDEGKFTFLAHPEDDKYNPVYKTNGYTVNYSWSPENAETYSSIRVVNNVTDNSHGQLEVDPNAPNEMQVWVRATVPKSGNHYDFPVYIFKPFGTVSAKKTYDEKNLAPSTQTEIYDVAFVDNTFAESGFVFDVLDLINNRADLNEEKNNATYQFSMTDNTVDGWGAIGDRYGISAVSNNPAMVSSMWVNTTSSGEFIFDGSTFTLGTTTIDVVIYPIAYMTIDGVPNQKAVFDLKNDQMVQKKVVLPVNNRNEFRRDDEPEEKGPNNTDGKLYFERDGERLSPASDVIYAFSYPSSRFPEEYYTTFKVQSDVPVGNKNEVVFELIIKQDDFVLPVITGSNLNTILSIRANGAALADLPDFKAPYNATFTIAIRQPGNDYVKPNIKMWLRVRSFYELTPGVYSNLGDLNGNGIGDDENEKNYAIAEIELSGTRAIDEMFINEAPMSTADARTNNVQAVSIIAPDTGETTAPELKIYASSFVRAGNTVDMELDYTKMKITTNNAPIKALVGAPVRLLGGNRNDSTGKWVGGTFTNYDTNGNGTYDL
ncbi:MAG: hypothetical protein LBQ05_02165, partial [Christensenellaceae bacterium]|nr:hypothetical protein [Christensenellaceae bacterium]